MRRMTDKARLLAKWDFKDYPWPGWIQLVQHGSSEKGHPYIYTLPLKPLIFPTSKLTLRNQGYRK